MRRSPNNWPERALEIDVGELGLRLLNVDAGADIGQGSEPLITPAIGLRLADGHDQVAGAQGTLAGVTDLSATTSVVRRGRNAVLKTHHASIPRYRLRSDDVDCFRPAGEWPKIQVGTRRVAPTARRPPGRDHRRAQAIWRRDKGSLTLANVGAGVDVKSQLQFTTSISRARSGSFRAAPHRGQGQHWRWSTKAPANRVPGGDADLERIRDADRAEGAIHLASRRALLRRLERRPLSGSGEFRNRPHALRQDRRGDQDRAGTAKVET